MILDVLTHIGGFLALGFVIGMAHTLEADHLAAMGTMLRGRDGPRRMLARGAFWGLGHSLALFAVAAAVLALGLTIPGRTEVMLELAVGAMICGLGLRVLWRLARERVHIHVHDHGSQRHIHAHSHAATDSHDHGHRASLGIGLVHGMAGSAGLMVLTAAAADNIAKAMGYIAVFGIGSIAGMAALTAVLSLPLGWIERGGTWAKAATSAVIGVAAIGVGAVLAVESALAIGG